MDKATFDYRKLRGRIKEKFATEQTFANAMGLGRVSLSGRLNNKMQFTQQEIRRAHEVLEIPACEIPTYFFKEKVQESEQNEIGA